MTQMPPQPGQSANMIPAGYLYKKVANRPGWLEAPEVADIYSLSGCMSNNFADYINYWQHNGYWLFDSPEAMEEIARDAGVNLAEMTLFYYEAYEFEFDEASREWAAFCPEPSFATAVREPSGKRLEGYDVATFCAHTSPECSPLSCNGLAAENPVNGHCLFRTFDEAKRALEGGRFDNSEPGPFRIFAVYAVHGGSGGAMLEPAHGH